MATIADIAKRAGVSMSTVSHVINNTRRVLPETAAIVERAIAELGYQPNQLARSLARASSSSIGVAISTTSNPYFSDLICEVQRECARQGLMVFLTDTEDTPDREFEVVKALHQQRVDGIILAPAPDPESRVLNYLTANQVPCVLIDRLSDERFDGAGVENREGMQQLVAHVLSHGHHRIGYVAGHGGFKTTLERLEGYRVALSDAGIDFDPTLVSAPTGDTRSAEIEAGGLLDLPDRPTAIVSGNNLATIGSIRAIKARGLTIPGNVALVGFDDFDWAADFEPQLTVLAQPVSAIGQEAVIKLVQRIQDATHPATHRRIPGELIIRASCGCPPSNSGNRR